MAKLNYTTVINAPREKVWKTLLDDQSYRQWTAPFHPGSYYKGSWEVGEKLLFIGPNDDGTEGGMVSTVAENRYPEYISIKHLGMIDKGEEIYSGPQVDPWAPSFENYTLNDKNGATEFVVEMTSPDEYKASFDEKWPKALAELKRLSEA